MSAETNLFDSLFLPEELAWLFKLRLIDKDTGGWAAFDTWTLVQNDAVVVARRLTLPAPAENHPGIKYPATSVTDVLDAMTPAELTALRERALGVLPFAPVTAEQNLEATDGPEMEPETEIGSPCESKASEPEMS